MPACENSIAMRFATIEAGAETVSRHKTAVLQDVESLMLQARSIDR
jgi:hypothetical protein